MQIQKYALAEERLDLGARRGAEGLNGAATLADDDPFLAVAFDVQHGPNIYRLGALPELVDLGRDAVGQLFMQLLERRLANEFGREEASRPSFSDAEIITTGPCTGGRARAGTRSAFVYTVTMGIRASAGT